MIPVILESPFTGNEKRNRAYLITCLKDCYRRGEIPYAFHAIGLLCLDDDDLKERELSINVGFVWRRFAAKTVVYTDWGISSGMRWGIKDAETIHDHSIEFRKLKKKSICNLNKLYPCTESLDKHHCPHWWEGGQCCFCGREET